MWKTSLLTNQLNITSNTNNISTINSKLLVDESNITNLLSDVISLKSYDLNNTTNVNNINNTLTNHTNYINSLNNTVIPELNNKFLIKNDPLITESILGKLKVDNLDSVNGTLNVLSASEEIPNLRGRLVITTDKVYKNLNNTEGYTESDSLGEDDYHVRYFERQGRY
jgi:hypothetical protein